MTTSPSGSRRGRRRLPTPAVLLAASLLLPLGYGAELTQSSLTTIERSSSSTIEAADWPQFRGPGGLGISDAATVPLTWSTTENVVWKRELPGPGASSPIVAGNLVYVTCYTGYAIPDQPRGTLAELQRHLIALRRETGEILWDRAVPAKLPEEEKIRDHGYAANTPSADQERVYAFFGKSGVCAFDHQGNALWQAEVGDGTSGWGTSASPILLGDLVLINASVESESLIALDRRTGKRKWEAKGIKEAWNTPLITTALSGRRELVVATHGSLKSFDPQTGSPYWTCQTDIDWYMAPSLIAHEGIVYSLGGRSGVAALAVRTGGRGDVTQTHRLWTSDKGSNVSSPVYHDGHLYWMHDQRGVAFCAEADTGKVLYAERLERAGQVYASALLADGRVYYLNRKGRTFVLAARPSFELLAVNDLADGGQFNGSPVASGKRLLIRSDNYLYCLAE